MKIIVSKKNEKYGPFDIFQIQHYVNVGFFQLTDFCYEEGWEKWKMLSSIVSRLPELDEEANRQNSFEYEDTKQIEVPKEKDFYHHTLEEMQDKKTVKTDRKTHWNENKSVNKTEISGICAQKMTNMSLLGFLSQNSNQNRNKGIYLARNGEILECCPKKQIVIKLSAGQLFPDDWFFDDSVREWKRLRDESW